MLLTTKEAAERVKCHPHTIRLHIRSGTLPAVKFGRRWKVEVADLLALLKTPGGAA